MIEPAIERIIEKELKDERLKTVVLDSYLYGTVRENLVRKVAMLGRLRNRYTSIELGHTYYDNTDRTKFVISMYIENIGHVYFDEFDQLWEFLDHQHLLYRKF